MSLKLPTLYSRRTDGRVQEWTIQVLGNKYRMISGLTDGEKVTSEWTECQGKNIGRSNETSPQEQARSEAQAAWTKKRERGYFENQKDVDQTAYFEPMLAQKYEDYKNDLEFPVFAQPKLDGCLFRTTILQTSEGPRSIEEIVENELKVDVLSYNEVTEQLEFRPVVAWHKNGLLPYDSWLEVVPEYGRPIKCTADHRFLTTGGWKEARDLDPKTDKILSERIGSYRMGLLAGTLLGDTSISIDRRGLAGSWRLYFQHTNKEYFDFKVGVLGLTGNTSEAKTGYGSKAWRFVSSALTYSDFPIDRFYYFGNSSFKGARKEVNYTTLKELLSSEGLALWIGDDGSLSQNNGNPKTPCLSLHTQGFSKKQIATFLTYFERIWNCFPTPIVDKRVKERGNKEGLFLQFSTKDTLLLLNNLRGASCRGVEYKYYFPVEGYVSPAANVLAPTSFHVRHSKRMSAAECYDLEVEGNHNYLANGTLVHNCRAIATKEGLFSRNGKRFHAVPHIEGVLTPIFKDEPQLILDGELYADKLSDNFNRITSLVRKSKPSEQDLRESAKEIQYWVYDLPSLEEPFERRWNGLVRLLQRYEDLVPREIIVKVPTRLVESSKKLDALYGDWLESGFEGQIVRLNGPYENKRSKHLLKRKEFMDAEFQVLDVEEGVGNRSKMAGRFILRDKKGNVFRSNIKGDRALLRDYLQRRGELQGKLATVQFFQYTPDGIPRFPFVIAIRDYE